jgi:hypothetical protein
VGQRRVDGILLCIGCLQLALLHLPFNIHELMQQLALLFCMITRPSLLLQLLLELCILQQQLGFPGAHLGCWGG